ncbi:thiamine phosphate synthase [Aneurinibacillus thermoaerophilus]|uniref:thiamine phosphate synthase n=1 Tax=Aneurinibacillus thermoaerophilus TaxID=143495 RepID=UPI002E23A708|nr:thiamine phosphate synthase [Aneurinibacillus thermoaerophilus]MED0764140.1 thiamine phosphate synthase [Aneurinibacillus thermoaerophilus]
MQKHVFHVISSGKQSLVEAKQIIANIHPYIDAFHLREKQRTARELWEWTQTLGKVGLTREKLIINDRADVALAAGAVGIQTAYHSLPAPVMRHLAPSLLLGVSVHSVEEAKAAEAAGADYVLFGHVFASASKPGQAGRGLAALREVVESVSIPVIALGGITPENTVKILATGCTGIAVLSAVMQAKEPVLSVQQFQQAISQVRTSPRHVWPTAKTEGSH